jgi:hypothetical protein
MLSNEDIKAFQAAGFTFEEIEHIKQSFTEFEKTGRSYTEQEVWSHLDSVRNLRFTQNA